MTNTIKIPSSHGIVEVVFFTDANSVPQASVQINGVQVFQSAHSIPNGSEFHPTSRAIWRKYCYTHSNNFITRSGFGLCGCYDYDPSTPRNYRNPESVSEHTHGCVELAKNLCYFYPDLLSDNEFRRLENLLQNHDLGENPRGDQPDDGSADKSAKDCAELVEFVSATLDLPNHIRNTLVSDFIKFQDPLYTNLEVQRITDTEYASGFTKFADITSAVSDAKVIQLAKVIDKAEAILSAVFYELHDAKGDLSYKEATFGGLTELDRSHIRDTCGDSSIAIAWMVHMVKDWHTCYGFPYVFDIVKAAIIELRGEWFPWFDHFCADHHIPQDHITLV